ncbi:unnamed protein product [Ectocarpus sp. CCAP 1310/34]|nr:unnamed protein product [Ectocarpus sp. CCAP 1310/34]
MASEALEERWLEEQTRIARAVVDTDDVLWTLDQPPERNAATARRPTPPPQHGQTQTEPKEMSSAAVGGMTKNSGDGSGGGGGGSRDGGPPETPPPPAIVTSATPGRLLRLVGGVDISFVKGSEENACASLVVLDFPSLKTVYEAYERVTMNHPYISGFLAFREVDHLARLVGQLRRERPDLEPDVVFVDGNGRLHPRGAGLACHLGVVTGLRTVGLGKTFLQVDGLTKVDVRERAKVLLSAGKRETPLLGTSGTVWGTALVPKEEEGKKGGGVVTSPVFVSIGHRVSLETCVALTKAVCRFRVPEPIRQADMRSREVIREWLLERRGKAEGETKKAEGPSPPPPSSSSLS